MCVYVPYYNFESGRKVQGKARANSLQIPPPRKKHFTNVTLDISQCKFADGEADTDEMMPEEAHKLLTTYHFKI